MSLKHSLEDHHSDHLPHRSSAPASPPKGLSILENIPPPLPKRSTHPPDIKKLITSPILSNEVDYHNQIGTTEDTTTISECITDPPRLSPSKTETTDYVLNAENLVSNCLPLHSTEIDNYVVECLTVEEKESFRTVDPLRIPSTSTAPDAQSSTFVAGTNGSDLSIYFTTKDKNERVQEKEMKSDDPFLRSNSPSTDPGIKTIAPVYHLNTSASTSSFPSHKPNTPATPAIVTQSLTLNRITTPLTPVRTDASSNTLSTSQRYRETIAKIQNSPSLSRLGSRSKYLSNLTQDMNPVSAQLSPKSNTDERTDPIVPINPASESISKRTSRLSNSLLSSKYSLQSIPSDPSSVIKQDEAMPSVEYQLHAEQTIPLSTLLSRSNDSSTVTLIPSPPISGDMNASSSFVQATSRDSYGHAPELTYSETKAIPARASQASDISPGLPSQVETQLGVETQKSVVVVSSHDQPKLEPMHTKPAADNFSKSFSLPTDEQVNAMPGLYSGLKTNYSETAMFDHLRSYTMHESNSNLTTKLAEKDQELQVLANKKRQLELEYQDTLALIQQADGKLQQLDQQRQALETELQKVKVTYEKEKMQWTRDRHEWADQQSEHMRKFDTLETDYMRVRIKLQDVTSERDTYLQKNMDDAATLKSILSDLKMAEDQAREVTTYAKLRLEAANSEISKCHHTYRLRLGVVEAQLARSKLECSEYLVQAKDASGRVNELQAILDELLDIVDRKVEESERLWSDYITAHLPVPPEALD